MIATVVIVIVHHPLQWFFDSCGLTKTARSREWQRDDFEVHEETERYEKNNAAVAVMLVLGLAGTKHISASSSWVHLQQKNNNSGCSGDSKGDGFVENHKDTLRISLEDMQSATDHFHDKHCVGQGGFGKVYKGKLPQDDHTIVAKLLDVKGGYCSENDLKIIVYEYASRGSLDRYLNETRLAWTIQLKICIDVPTALDFLHSGIGKQAAVIHRDIKAANILLNNDWNAKLADFGLSLISAIDKETDYAIERACGTPGYVDPRYLKSRLLTKESDIYSFGVVLFELLCGSTFLIHEKEGVFLSSFVKHNFDKEKVNEVVLKNIKTQIMPEALNVFYTIACQCLHDNREDRPTAQVVVQQLKKALELQMSSGDGASSFLNKYFTSSGRLKFK
ncbi:probable receptor-like protein kinase At5g38990 [Rutidosis leptorrhynchoides]|uniref:probable receptor-like protein kinase At5g38990 n=1 Tax=Rutidosis leptorrhynchoides TaxID=125765 RepID=UPI003A990FD9